MAIKKFQTKMSPNSVHFVGIGGIGMSALAQMLKWQGVIVSGSDRAINNPENHALFSALKEQGIKLYPQDGSFIKDSIPDTLIYSTAIEDDNPDFLIIKKIEESSKPKLIHRSEMVAIAISALKSETIAISGSCGKTTVTAWLSEILFLSNLDPLMIGGGVSNIFIDQKSVGNFHSGNGSFAIFEADESDKSLLKYSPDYAIILNIGTDHYPKEELKELFNLFLKRIKKGVIVSDEVFNFLGKENFSHLKVAIFADATKKEQINIPINNDILLTKYTPTMNGSTITLNEKSKISLPFPGKHSALNGAAIVAMCNMIGVSTSKVLENISKFKGVWRRFDYAGITKSGAKVYDDYAHNVEKIISSIKTAKEVATEKIIVIFQPHGFGPLKFMSKPLFLELEKILSDDDIFALLPVYYVGGTTSFTPKSLEVIKEYNSKSKKKYILYSSREEILNSINSISSSGDVIIIMGARDNSLSSFAKKLTC